MLCFKTPHYVLAACISVVVHRKFISKLKQNIDLVVMCDAYIHENYGSLLSQFFDRVSVIEMQYYPPSKSYIYPVEKYSKWIGYSLNKFQCLKYTEYNRVLFIDIDVLVSSEKFYDLFLMDTPAIVHNGHKECKKCKGEFPETYDEYLKQHVLFGTMNAGLFLMKPSLELYNQYSSWTQQLYSNGIYSMIHSGPDETSMYYFLKGKFENITSDYLVIHWDSTQLIPIAKSYNFASFIKPWNKPKFLCWNEELLWHTIYERIPVNIELKRLYEEVMLDSVKVYLAFNQEKRKKYYNQDYLRQFKVEANEIFKTPTLAGIKQLDSKIKPKDHGAIRVDELLSLL